MGRIELTFNNGKFIAWDDVIEDSVNDRKAGWLSFLVRHPKYENDRIVVNTNNLYFVEFFEGKKTE